MTDLTLSLWVDMLLMSFFALNKLTVMSLTLIHSRFVYKEVC